MTRRDLVAAVLTVLLGANGFWQCAERTTQAALADRYHVKKNEKKILARACEERYAALVRLTNPESDAD